MGCRVVFEEESLVLRVSLDPTLGLRILEELEVGLGLEVVAVVSKQDLLEVGVVEHVRVHGPTALLALVVVSCKAEGVRAHQGHVLLGSQTHHVELLHHH